MALSVRSYGEGRPVVLLPWFGLDSTVTAAAFEPAFSDTSGWQRHYLDLPGTGNSSPIAPTSDAVLAAVADAIRDLIGDTPHALAGCSYGGYLAAALAGRPQARIAGLLLVCAGVNILPAERNLSGLVAPAPQPGWLDAIPQEWHQHFQHAIGVQSPQVARRVFEAVKGSTGMDDYLDVLRATGYRLSDEDATRAYGGPTSLLAGTRDRVAGYLDLVGTLPSYPNGDFHALSNAGHYLPFEQPLRFRALVRYWLTRTATSATTG
jgi:pimeloyl-ACP methyl ester carboxylesterase